MGRGRRKHGAGAGAGAGHGQPEPDKLKPAPDATTSLGSLLKAAKVEVKPPPPAKTRAGGLGFGKTAASASPYAPRSPFAGGAGVRDGAGADGISAETKGESSATELRMLNDAYDGARPLSQKARKNARQVVQRAVQPGRRSEEERVAEAAARKRLAQLVSGGVHFKVQRDDDHVRAFRNDSARKLVDRLGGQGFQSEASLDLHGERTARISDLVSAFVRGHHRRGARHLLIIVGKGLHSEDGQGVLLGSVIEALTQGLAAPLVRGFATAHQRLGGTGAVAVLLI